MNIEDHMSAPELRRELRREWDDAQAFASALRDLPEIPSIDAQRFIVNLHGVTKFPEDQGRGAELQRSNPGVIPYKCEYELAAGFWSRLRKGLLENPA